MPPSSRPNLILITTDQQRFDTIHAAGNGQIFTPHLNWLVDTGILFSRAYSDAPICVAARATMITGTPFYRMNGHGNWGQPTAPDSNRTLPGLLTAAGYQTRSVGKLHFHPPRCHYGFEHIEILEDYYRERSRLGPPFPMEHGVGQNEMEPVLSTVGDAESLTHWIANRAVDFLETRDESRPFFLNVGFSKPHPPFDPAPNFWALYQNEDVPPPLIGDWSSSVGDIPRGFLGSTFTLNGADRFSPAQLRAIRRAYYACITQIDYNLGLLFARLRELELLENTLIVFAADHGEMLGDHHLGAKSVFMEGATHIPLIVRPPREAERFAKATFGPRCDTLVSLADLMPTFLAAAGLTRPSDLPTCSQDLCAISEGAFTRRHLAGAYADQFMMIEDHWKYVFTSQGGGELLFDLEHDPGERHNLIPTHPDKRDALARLLSCQLAEQGHPVSDGKGGLNILSPAEQDGNRRRRWPGFHSREHTRPDVLH